MTPEPLVQLTVQGQGMFKYHASSCCGLSRSARSLTSIRDRLNEGSAGMVSNRVVKQQVLTKN